MKRSIVLALIFILLSVDLHAQSISGIWCQTVNESQDGMAIEMYETMTLDENGLLNETSDVCIELSDSKSADKLAFKFRILCSGKWQYADGILFQTFDVKTLKTEFLEKPEDLPNILTNMITKAIVSEFKKAAKKPISSKVLSISYNSLKLKEMDNNDAVEETYILKVE